MFDEHNDYVNSAQHSRHLQMLQQSANEGDAEAQYELADCYFLKYFLDFIFVVHNNWSIFQRVNNYYTNA